MQSVKNAHLISKLSFQLVIGSCYMHKIITGYEEYLWIEIKALKWLKCQQIVNTMRQYSDMQPSTSWPCSALLCIYDPEF